MFRGFGKHIEKLSEIDSVQFAGAFQAGVDTAYKAVMKPVEGTILTVAREAAAKAVEVAKEESDVIKVMEALVEEGSSIIKPYT
ncbi:DhaL domain-containing protein OS=Ureibacillus acetophenoni OX=614649 GN=SAMN05877842_101431 PE=4 SV=1 [Ureibacillus acetophenoni]